MFDIGFAELLICAIVALLVLGPERLPGAVRTVGRWVGRARHTVNHFTEQIDREIRAEELKRRLDEELRELRASGLEDIDRQVREAMRHPLPLPSQSRADDSAQAGPATAAEVPPATNDARTDAAEPPAATSDVQPGAPLPAAADPRPQEKP